MANKSFRNCVDFKIKQFNAHKFVSIFAEKIIKNFQNYFTLFVK